MVNKLNWKGTKYLFLCLISIVILVNIHMTLNDRYNTNNQETTSVVCNSDQKLVLAELANYYEKLLQRKGIDSKVIKEAIASNKEKTFDVFDNELNVGKLPEEELIKKGAVVGKERHFPPSRETEDEVKTIGVQGDRKIRNFRLSAKKDVFKGLVVDWWSDFCIQRVTWKSLWHPLFPTIPQHTTIALKTEDNERILGGVYRRLYGFFFLKANDGTAYDFKLSSRDGAEVIIIDSGFSIDEIHRADNVLEYRSTSEVMHLRLTKGLMDYQDRRIQLEEMFTIEKNGVQLKRNHLYHIEILQGGLHFGKYSLEWRKSGTQEKFVALNKENLCHLVTMSGKNTPSLLKQKYKPPLRYQYGEEENRKVRFYNRPALDSRKQIDESSYKCRPVAKDYKKISYTYQGYYEYVENVVVYPKENYHYTQTATSNIHLPSDEALNVADKVFEKLTNMHKKLV